MKWFGIMWMAALLAIVPGYGSAEPQGKPDPAPATQTKGLEAKGEPAGAAKDYTPDERRAYERKTAADLEAIQKKVYDLRVKATTGAPQKKDMILRTVKDLQFQMLAARNQLKELEKAPETAWIGAKASLDKTMTDLQKTWEAAEGYLK
jgi:hypothetical protein